MKWQRKDVIRFVLGIPIAFLLSVLFVKFLDYFYSFQNARSAVYFWTTFKFLLVATCGWIVHGAVFMILEILGHKYEKQTKRKCILCFIAITFIFAVLSGYL